MSSSKLEKLYNLLTHANDKRVFNYTVPDLWNCFDYDKASFIKTPSNELMVNPYDFYASVIKQAILPKRKNSFNYGKSLSSLLQTKPTNGNWIKKAVMYSTLVRASAAWDHDRSGHLEEKNLYGMPETGSFVKMIALLPLLVKMGVNAIYLLPISRFSTKNKKGELGSPYGITHFTELDPGLKDPLTSSSMTLEEEFQAFVEIGRAHV